MIESLDRHLDAILACPTAPFREIAVLRVIDAFAAERGPRVRLRIDPCGNRILAVRGARAGRAAPTIAFTAHLDHPAFVRGDDGTWELLGRVLPECLPGAALRFHREDASAAGTGRVVDVESRDGRVLARLARDGGAEKPGDFATFDFPALTRAADRLTGRVCDDLMGAIAILAAIDETLAREPGASWLAVFTRAEEVGLVGATLLMKGRLVPRTIPVVGLECSAARGGNAVVGDGPIVRVGDKVATFDPGTTAFLRDCAESIAREDSTFRWQRRLMQGGTCES
ncbi:MAG TPA: hypothetical protein VKE69_09365, partial [Planctomycetota bacterium]|nr:hypothetical protein [Planctomycetota bacterium]